METELRSKRRPAAADGRAAVTGLGKKKKKVNFFLRKEPNEENKGGRALVQEERARLHTHLLPTREETDACVPHVRNRWYSLVY